MTPLWSLNIPNMDPIWAGFINKIQYIWSTFITRLEHIWSAVIPKLEHMCYLVINKFKHMLVSVNITQLEYRLRVTLTDLEHRLRSLSINDIRQFFLSMPVTELALYIYLAYEVIIFICVCFIYKRDRWKAIYVFIILSLMPLIGVIFLAILGRTKQNMKTSIYTYNPEFIMGNLESSAVKRVNVEREINVVPIQDALILNDSSTKRSLLIDSFRDDVFTSIGFLKKALQDEDPETSHYAASAMTEVVRKLTLAIQELSVKYENDKDNLEIAIAYVDMLTKYISSGVLDERTRLQFQYTCSHVLSNINRIAPDNSKYYVDKIDCDLELKEYDNALTSCQQFMTLHSDKEEPYFMYLKTYYLLHDYERFNQMLDNLKRSSVKLSYQGLMKIRFWLGRSNT